MRERTIIMAIMGALVWVLYILNQPEVQQKLSNLYQGWMMP